MPVETKHGGQDRRAGGTPYGEIPKLIWQPSDQHRSKASTLLVTRFRLGRSLLVGGIPSMRIRVSFPSLPSLQGNQLEHTSGMAPNPPYAAFAANDRRPSATQYGIPTEVKGRKILPRRKLPLLGTSTNGTVEFTNQWVRPSGLYILL
jgi:hypothetical protein